MSKILRVIEPFFVLNVDDTLTLAEGGKFYIAEHNEEFRGNSENADLMSSYKASFTISTKWAKQLIEDGFLEEVIEKQNNDKKFVNVFDEIDNLLENYQEDLNNINNDMADEPECVRVEKTTVLTNIIKVLNHLKTLRK